MAQLALTLVGMVVAEEAIEGGGQVLTWQAVRDIQSGAPFVLHHSLSLESISLWDLQSRIRDIRSCPNGSPDAPGAYFA